MYGESLGLEGEGRKESLGFGGEGRKMDGLWGTRGESIRAGVEEKGERWMITVMGGRISKSRRTLFKSP